MARLEDFRTRIKWLPIHKRFTIINTFITPIYSYLAQFFLFPYPFREEYIQRVHSACTPYGGKAFSSKLIVAPPHAPGFAPAVRDPWAANVNALALHAWGNRPKLEDIMIFMDEGSLLISDHGKLALKEYLGRWGNKGESREITRELLEGDIPTKRKMYQELVESAYGKTYAKEWKRKIRVFHHWGSDHDVSHFFSNWKAICQTLPPHVRTRYLSLVLNATHTSVRIRHWVAPRKEKNNTNFPCPFCHNGTDDVRHFTSDCETIRVVFAQIAEDARIWGDDNLIETEGMKDVSLLNYDPNSLPDPKHTGRMIIGLVSSLPLLRKRVIAKGNTTNLQRELEGFLTSALTGERDSKGRKTRAGMAVLERIAEVPDDTIIAYTDGSSFGNPGPAGAGAYILHPTAGFTNFYLPLGDSTNNVGELWAIEIVLQHARDEEWEMGKILIVSDSKYAIGVLTKKHRAKKNSTLIAYIRYQMGRGELQGMVYAPGHLRIRGNEIADRLAKTGARESRRRNLTVPPKAMCGFNFLANTPIL